MTPGTYGKINVPETAPFIARVTYRDRNTGKYHDVTAQGESKEKAENNLKNKLLDFEPPAGGGQLTRASLSGELFEAWFIRKSAAKKCTKATLTNYRRTLNRHVLPALGSLEIFKLDGQPVDKLLIDLSETRRTEAKRARTIIRGAVKLGISYGLFNLDFMVAAFEIPGSVLDVRILDRAEIDLVFGLIDGWRTAPGTKGPKLDGQLGQVFRIMLGAGLRIGEVCALRVKDIAPPPELGQPWTISVRGTIITPDEGPTFRQDHPKTSNGFRTVPVPGFVAEVLAARLALVADVPDKEQLLFYSRNGTAMQPGNLRRTWRTIRAANEQLGFVVPHTLRKTLATLLAETGDPAYAAAFLGHGRDTATLFRHYVRRNQELAPEGATVLDLLAPAAQLALTQ